MKHLLPFSVGQRRAAGACRRLGAALLALGLVCLRAPPAHAIGDDAPIDLNRFRPATGSGRILTIDLADVGRTFELVPQLVLHYARLPLAYSFGGRIEREVVAHRLTADVAIAVSLLGRLQLSLSLPVTLYQSGQTTSYPDPGTGETRTLPPLAVAGQEDLRFQVKARFWSNAHFGVGGAVDVIFPTGNASSFLGSSNVTGTARVLGHLAYGRLSVGLNLGWRFAAVEERLLNVRAGNSLVYGLGAQVVVYRFRPGIPLSLLGEVYGLAHYRFDRVESIPVELLLAAKTEVKNWTFFAGAGPGLTRGYGEPRVRALIGVAYAWRPGPRPLRPRRPPPPPPPESPPAPPQKKVEVPVQGDRLRLEEPVYFDFDRDTIRPESYPLLDEVVRILAAHPEYGAIRIDGHTDARGTDEYNRELSLRRARAVHRYLVEHGIPASRLSFAGYGKRCPVVSSDSEDAYKINRRVDFILVERERRHPGPGECPERPEPPPSSSRPTPPGPVQVRP